MRGRKLILSLFFAAALLSGARADDVTDQMNEAMAAYGRKDTSTAIAALEAALDMLRQHRADAYGALLPGPLAGWTADDVETVSMGIAVAGGGTGATRKYHKDNATVTISILADSPLMPALTALTNSGIAALSGLRTQIVGGRRTIYVKDEGSFTTIVGDRIMVRVEGKGLPEDTLKQFLTAVDFAKVEKIGK